MRARALLLYNNFVYYRHECFAGKYTSRKIHMKLHLAHDCRIFLIITSSENTDDVISRSFVQLFVKTVSETGGERQISLCIENRITRWLEDMSFRFLELKAILH